MCESSWSLPFHLLVLPHTKFFKILNRFRELITVPRNHTGSATTHLQIDAHYI